MRSIEVKGYLVRLPVLQADLVGCALRTTYLEKCRVGTAHLHKTDKPDGGSMSGLEWFMFGCAMSTVLALLVFFWKATSH